VRSVPKKELQELNQTVHAQMVNMKLLRNAMTVTTDVKHVLGLMTIVSPVLMKPEDQLMNAIASMDTMKPILLMLNAQNVKTNAKHALMPPLVSHVLMTESQDPNQPARAHMDNTFKKTTLVDIVTTHVIHVKHQPPHVLTAKETENYQTALAQLEHTKDTTKIVTHV
jgi:hypothetical protein